MFEWISKHAELFKMMSIVLFLVVLVMLILVAKKVEGKEQSNKIRIKKMTLVATLSALSVILYFWIKIPINVFIPFMPGFLDIHFSSVPIYIGGYILGPISGLMIAIIRFIVKAPFTTTATIGEFADLIIATATVLVTAIIYHKHKTKETAIRLSIVTVAIWMITAVFANWLIILPFYIGAYGFDVVFNMMSTVPGITETNFMFYYLMIVAVPFNFILSSLVSLLTFVTYKKLSRAFHSILAEN